MKLFENMFEEDTGSELLCFWGGWTGQWPVRMPGWSVMNVRGAPEKYPGW